MPRLFLDGFAEAVTKHAKDTAFISGDSHLTYAELDSSSDRIAAELATYGVSSNHVIAVITSRDLRLPTGIMGVIKSGAAYLAIDPKGPVDRNRYMISKCNVKVAITDRPKEQFGFLSGGIDVVNIGNLDLGLPEEHAVKGSRRSVQPRDLAYVVFTSGSTGLPKGVMVEHSALASVVDAIRDRIPLERKVLYALAAVTFDIHVFEILVSLCYGMTMVIASDREMLSPDLQAKSILSHRIQVYSGTPSRMQMLLTADDGAEAVMALSDIMLVGEPLPARLSKNIRESSSARLYNMYGPAEATIYATSALLESDEVPIGTPLSNCFVKVLDDHGNEVTDQIGELWIGGEGLARGYINDPERTQERFTSLPGDTRRLYRTGDLAIRSANGNLYYKGRVDRQLKVRGIRVEPEEIEALLVQHESVVTAHVFVANESDAPMLCAGIIAKSGFDSTELRQWLSLKIPQALIPSRFYLLDQLPQNASGKVDEIRIPLLGRLATLVCTADLRERRSPIAARLISVIEKQFPEGLPFEESFFSLGLTSMSMVQITAMLRRAGFDLSVSDLVENPSLSQLAEFLSRNNSIDMPRGVTMSDKRLDAEPTKVGDVLPLTPMQLFMAQFAFLRPNHPVYHEQIILECEGDWDFSRHIAALDSLTKIYAHFTTTYNLRGARGPYQVYGDRQEPIPAQEFDFAMLEREVALERAETQIVDSRIRSPFRSSPVRTLVTLIDSHRFFLVWNYHHLALDGESASLVIQEYLRAYCDPTDWQNRRRPTIPDFGMFVRSAANYQEGDSAYWHNHGIPPKDWLSIPSNLVGVTGVAHLSRHRIEIHAGDSEILEMLSRSWGATLSSLLQVIWCESIGTEQGGAGPVAYGLVTSRRQIGAGQFVETPGMLISVIPVCYQPSFKSMMEKVREHQLQLSGLLAHPNVSAWDVWKLRERPGDLEQVLIFNEESLLYRIDATLKSIDIGFRVVSASTTDETDFKLTVVFSGPRYRNMELIYHNDEVDPRWVQSVSHQFELLVKKYIMAYGASSQRATED